jgi:hypothetical protein
LLLLDWAREVETAKLRMIAVRVRNELRRETACRGIVAPRLKVAAKSLMLRLFEDYRLVNFSRSRSFPF